MRMVPASPHDTGSQAEKRIFERLRTAFDDRYAAFHSLRPPRHTHKRFSEIDFVICGPEGLYVLEVKGGNIACHDGVWRYRDRYGRSTPSHEGPFRRAQTALHGLMEDLWAHLPADVLDRFTIGYGVVFPDCDWPSDGAEWDPEMLADARRIRRLDDYSMRNIPGDTVGFARIEEFKGLENEAIVVVDLPAPAGADLNSAAHYVAMSRARSVLSLIYRSPS